MPKQLKIYTIENKQEERSLREKSSPVDEKEFKSPDFLTFLEDLLYTAQHSEEQDNVPAGGIAAPQVGKNIRVFYTLNYDTNKWQIFINPTIEPLGYAKIISSEGCLSVPNREEDVMRYKKIKVRYQDRDGKWKTKKFKDINAIAIQHELDHLEGILFIDRIEGVE
jgi:peptide deformylase